MADTVNSYKIEDGPRNLVYRFTSESDGTGESGVQKVDVSGLSNVDGINPPTHLAIREVSGRVWGMNYLTVYFDATTDDEALVLKGEVYEDFDPPFNDPRSTGSTGDILFTTDGASDGGGYDLTIKFIKKQ